MTWRIATQSTNHATRERVSVLAVKSVLVYLTLSMIVDLAVSCFPGKTCMKRDRQPESVVDRFGFGSESFEIENEPR